LATLQPDQIGNGTQQVAQQSALALVVAQGGAGGGLERDDGAGQLVKFVGRLRGFRRSRWWHRFDAAQVVRRDVLELTGNDQQPLAHDGVVHGQGQQ
jgi:hypothetical protein